MGDEALEVGAGVRGGAVVVADVAVERTVRAVGSGDVACWFPVVTRCAMLEFWCPCVRFVGSWCSEGVVRVVAGEFGGSGAWVLGEDGLGVRWQCGSTKGGLVLCVHAELAFDDVDGL